MPKVRAELLERAEDFMIRIADRRGIWDCGPTLHRATHKFLVSAESQGQSGRREDYEIVLVNP